MPFLAANLVLYLAVLFLLIESIWDQFRSVEIPFLLLWAPFCIAIIQLIFERQFIVLAAAGLLFLFAFSINKAILRRILCCACLVTLTAIRWDIGFFIAFFWLIYELNIFAGAEMIACVSLMLIRPDWILAFWLLLGIGVGSWAIGLRRDGLSFFKKSFQALASLKSNHPKEEMLLNEGAPFLWAIFLGSFLYVLMDAFVLGKG
jgi:hypothetical protein